MPVSDIGRNKRGGRRSLMLLSLENRTIDRGVGLTGFSRNLGGDRTGSFCASDDRAAYGFVCVSSTGYHFSTPTIADPPDAEWDVHWSIALHGMTVTSAGSDWDSLSG